MGRSSSTTSQEVTNVQDIDTQNISSEGEGNVSLGVSGGGIIHFAPTDLGAVDSAFDFADRFGGQALSTVGRTTEQTLDFAGDFASDVISRQAAQNEQTINTLGGAITRAADATRSDTSQTLQKIAMYAAIAVGVIFVAMQFKK